MEVYECIKKRRSVRWFKDEPVPDELVEKILDAARLAPSAGNRQEWAFIVVKDREVKRKLMEAVVEIQKSLYIMWRRLELGGPQLEYLAGELSKMTGRKITVKNIQEQKDLSVLLDQFTDLGVGNMFNAGLVVAAYVNSVEGTYPDISNSFDAGAAMENMLLTATAYGFGSLWAGGFVREQTKSEYKPVGTAIHAFYRDKISEVLGVPKEMTLVSLVFVGKPAVEPPAPPKKPLEEVAFIDRYGNRWKKG